MRLYSLRIVGLLLSLFIILLLTEPISAQGPENNEIVIIEEDVIKEYDFNWNYFYQEHKVFPIRPSYEIPEFDGNGRTSRFIQVNATGYTLKFIKCRWFNLTDPDTINDLDDIDNGNDLTLYEVQISSSSIQWSLISHNVSENHSLFIGYEIALDPNIILEHKSELYSVRIRIVNETLTGTTQNILFSFEIRIKASFRIVYEWYYFYDYYFPSNPTTNIIDPSFNIILNPIMIAVIIDIFVVLMIRKDYKKRKRNYQNLIGADSNE